MSQDVFGLVGATADNRYRIDGVVGEGGFGVVYRGWHLAFNHAIAVKCLKVPGHFTLDAQRLFFEKFREEGAILSSLSEHPSIVRVFDFGETQGRGGARVPYLVLEWLEGMTLEERMHSRPGPMEEREAVALVRPAMDAIALAHAKGIAHRDVKPANLYEAQTKNGPCLKVLDFGIAKAMQEGETATQVANRTSTQFRAFSWAYGAPEQYWSKIGTTGPWTDVHALGLILTELVSGKVAYEGSEHAEYLMAATSAVRPTPRARGAQVSDEFERLCARALSLHPRERFQSARQLMEALDRMVEPVRQAPPPWSSLAQGGGTEAAAPATAAFRHDPSADPVVVPPRTSGTQVASCSDLEASRRRAGQVTQPKALQPPGNGQKKKRLSGPVFATVVVGAAALGLGMIVLIASSAEHKNREQGTTVSMPPSAPTAGSSSAATPSATTRVPPPAPTRTRAERAPLCAPDMVIIPAGRFSMGSTSYDEDEKPVREIGVGQFCIDKTEVTVGSYRKCVKASSCRAAEDGVAWRDIPKHEKSSLDPTCNSGKPGRDDHPINCIDLEQAQQFCTWAGKRLPTETEWEFAAAGSQSRLYPWGDTMPGNSLVCWRRGLSDGTCRVSSHEAGSSSFGVQDMAGNVWEWTSTPHVCRSPPCPPKMQVARGGGWSDRNANAFRCANKDGFIPGNRYHFMGVRCASSPNAGALKE